MRALEAEALHKKCDTTDFKSCGEFNFLARREAEFLRYPTGFSRVEFQLCPGVSIIGPH